MGRVGVDLAMAHEVGGLVKKHPRSSPNRNAMQGLGDLWRPRANLGPESEFFGSGPPYHYIDHLKYKTGLFYFFSYTNLDQTLECQCMERTAGNDAPCDIGALCAGRTRRSRALSMRAVSIKLS